jgi:hypothetical protein
MDPASFVFLDETGATTNMVRRYGWGRRGERLVDAAPHGHWCTTTFVAGLRSTGIIAPLVLDGPMTGEAFRAYVEQFLAPTLARGDVVVPRAPQARVPCRDRIDASGIDGQSASAQGCWYPRGDRCGRRQHPLSAAL